MSSSISEAAVGAVGGRWRRCEETLIASHLGSEYDACTARSELRYLTSARPWWPFFLLRYSYGVQEAIKQNRFISWTKVRKV